MKKILFLFFMAVATALTFSACFFYHRKEITVPADTKITFVVPTEERSEDYLILAADTTQDGIPDIEIKVIDWPAIARICFLKETYPDKDIKIRANSVHQGLSCWILKSRSTSAAEKTIFIN
jgi:hypothetical protein